MCQLKSALSKQKIVRLAACILFHCFKILYTNKNSMWSRRKTEWKELKFSFFVFQRLSLQHSAIIVYLSASV